jgi:hypothetical protein
LDEIFNADYRKMAFKYESDSKEVKEYEENHLKNYQLNILSASLLALLISGISFMYSGFNLFRLNYPVIYLENSEKKKLKGGNVFSLLLNNKNNIYIYLVNGFGVISFIGKGWIPFLSTYEPK